MRLGRGSLLLIGGGALAVISFFMLALQIISGIQAGERHVIEPEGSLEVRHHINATQGAYIVAIQNFEDGQAAATIRGPGGELVLERTVDQPFIFEPFPAREAGNYTLTLSNPTTRSIEASLLIGDQTAVLDMADVGAILTTTALSFLLIGGIIAAAAGAVITVLDRRRISKMKQFGDTSDLV